MKIVVVWLTVIGLFLAFCVFCYNVRTKYNVDALSEQVRGQAEAISILTYALSITPEEIRSEVFFNSIKENFPHVENHTNLLGFLKLGKKKVEGEEVEGNNEETETAKTTNPRTIGSTMEDIIGDMGPN